MAVAVSSQMKVCFYKYNKNMYYFIVLVELNLKLQFPNFPQLILHDP